MSLKVRELVSTGGPDGNSAWLDMGEQALLPAATVTTTPAIAVVQLIPTVDTQIAGGAYPGDSVVGGAAVARLNGAQVNFVTILAASIHFDLQVSVTRTATLGVAIAASVAITQVTMAYPLLGPMPEDQTFVITDAAGNTKTFTSLGVTAAGSTVVMVDSVTPANAYAVGNPVVFQVGLSAAFGWVAGASAGTPVFGAKQSVAMPAITTNSALVTPTNGSGSYLPLAQGDRIEAITTTDSSTVTMPAGIVQTLVI